MYFSLIFEHVYTYVDVDIFMEDTECTSTICVPVHSLCLYWSDVIQMKYDKWTQERVKEENRDEEKKGDREVEINKDREGRRNGDREVDGNRNRGGGRNVERNRTGRGKF